MDSGLIQYDNVLAWKLMVVCASISRNGKYVLIAVCFQVSSENLRKSNSTGDYGLYVCDHHRISNQRDGQASKT